MMILGEYHHEDYKEKRRNQLEKDQENHDRLIHRLYENSKLNHFNSHSIPSHLSIQLSNKNSLL